MTIALATDKELARQSVFVPLTIVLVNRAGVILLAYLGLTLMPGIRNSRNVLPGNFFLNGWTRWDADWYVRIAANGYTNLPVDRSGQRDTAFLPLYPLLIRAVGWVLHDFDIGGWLVSNLAFIFAGLLLYRLVEIRWDQHIAQGALLLLCVYPFSYVFSAEYTESLFLLCCAGSFYFGQKRLWLPASLCAAAASATRITGVATAGAIALMYLQTTGWNARSLRNAFGWLAIGLSGIGAFILFLWVRFHQPLAMISAQNALGWSDLNSWQSLLHVLHLWTRADFNLLSSGNIPLLEAMNLLPIVIAVALAAAGLWKLPAEYSLWTLIILAMSLLRWNSFGRMSCVVFPLFIVAATMLKDRRLLYGMVYLSTLLLALFTLMYTHGWWVA